MPSRQRPQCGAVVAEAGVEVPGEAGEAFGALPGSRVAVHPGGDRAECLERSDEGVADAGLGAGFPGEEDEIAAVVLLDQRAVRARQRDRRGDDAGFAQRLCPGELGGDRLAGVVAFAVHPERARLAVGGAVDAEGGVFGKVDKARLRPPAQGPAAECALGVRLQRRSVAHARSAVRARMRGIAVSKRCMTSSQRAGDIRTPGLNCSTRRSSEEKIAQTPVS